VTEVSPRSIALDCMTEIEGKGRFLQVVLGEALSKYGWMDFRDRSFLTRLLHGTLEYMDQTDRILERYSTVRVSKMKPVIRNILRLSACQILHMDKIPDMAVCNEAVKLTKKRGLYGLSGFVNGVTRHMAHDREKIKQSIRESSDMSFRYSVPDWMVRLLCTESSRETAETVLKTFLEPQKVCIRLNRSFFSSEEAKKEMIRETEKQAEITYSPYLDNILYVSGFTSLFDLPLLKSGAAAVQDLSSVLAVIAADLKEGETVFDVCASPGGKSLEAADIMNGTGDILAMDVSAEKTAAIDGNIGRSGFKNIRTEVSDACVFREELSGKADAVLADLPCSGLGMIGSKPDIKMHVSPDMLISLSVKQKEILNNVCRYVKPGGRMIFSTCTIDPEENEKNRSRFLDTHGDFEPTDLTGILPHLPHAETLAEGYLQLLPGIHPCDGFFISAFRRKLS